MTATSGHRTHIGLGEIADLAAAHAVKDAYRAHVNGRIVCECRRRFDDYSEHAFHLATESVAYANGRRLDPLAEFDRRYGEDEQGDPEPQ